MVVAEMPPLPVPLMVTVKLPASTAVTKPEILPSVGLSLRSIGRESLLPGSTAKAVRVPPVTVKVMLIMLSM